MEILYFMTYIFANNTHEMYSHQSLDSNLRNRAQRLIRWIFGVVTLQVNKSKATTQSAQHPLWSSQGISSSYVVPPREGADIS